MKKIIVSFFLICAFQLTHGQKFSYGIFTALDFNVYNEFNEGSSDANGKGKLAIGLTLGGSFDYQISDIVFINSNPSFSQKKYFRNRKFDFGILRSVKQNNVAVPINVKVELNPYLYAFGGVTIQHVAQISTIYDFEPAFDLSSDFLKPSTHGFPNIGAGVKVKVDGATVKLQLNYRLLRGSQEFLNPGIDKIALGIIISR